MRVAHTCCIASLPFVSLIALSTLTAADEPSNKEPYQVAKTLSIGGDGGWDYLTVDSQNKLLYVPRSTHTMVIDAGTGKTVADIPGQKRNHGVAVVQSANRGFISDGDDACVVIFDLKTNEVLGKIPTDKDADGIIYDPASKKVFVVCGSESKMFAIAPDVDPKNGKPDAEIALGGEPEFLASDGKGKLFVNLMNKDQVAVVDTKTMQVTDHWLTAPGGQPVGMSIDPEKRRLFIGCRKPQKLIVMSADDGKVLANLPIGAGVDATRFDGGDAFASCRDGTLTVAHETAPGKFEVVQTLTTKPGARTMGLDRRSHTLYLPTAEMTDAAEGKRPTPKPGSFVILVVERNGN
jgi:DNA-binding beta-propeller fold protein YncE